MCVDSKFKCNLQSHDDDVKIAITYNHFSIRFNLVVEINCHDLHCFFATTE